MNKLVYQSGITDTDVERRVVVEEEEIVVINQRPLVPNVQKVSIVKVENKPQYEETIFETNMTNISMVSLTDGD